MSKKSKTSTTIKNKIILKGIRNQTDYEISYEDFMLFFEFENDNVKISYLTRKDIVDLIYPSNEIGVFDLNDTINFIIKADITYKFSLDYIGEIDRDKVFNTTTVREFSKKPNGKVKYRQHFIPQEALRYFTNSMGTRENNYYIYDKINKKPPHMVGIKDVYFWERPYLYTGKCNDLFIENTLFEFEENNIIDFRVIGPNMDASIKPSIAYYYSRMTVRNPFKIKNKMSENIAWLYENAYKNILIKKIDFITKEGAKYLDQRLHNQRYLYNNDLSLLQLYFNMLNGSWTYIKFNTERGIVAPNNLFTFMEYKGDKTIIIHLSFYELILIDLTCHENKISNLVISDSRWVDFFNDVVCRGAMHFIFYGNKKEEFENIIKDYKQYEN